jgi:hypothetical protein
MQSLLRTLTAEELEQLQLREGPLPRRLGRGAVRVDSLESDLLEGGGVLHVTALDVVHEPVLDEVHDSIVDSLDAQGGLDEVVVGLLVGDGVGVMNLRTCT